tara:strand:- start:199 stop:414 length:216 start_codon:yes stop_codon:yes gene_type:complete
MTTPPGNIEFVPDNSKSIDDWHDFEAWWEELTNHRGSAKADLGMQEFELRHKRALTIWLAARKTLRVKLGV